MAALAAPAAWAWYLSGRQLAATTEAEQWRLVRHAAVVPGALLRPSRSGCGQDPAWEPVGEPDWLAGPVGGGADRHHLVLRRGVEGLPVRGDRDHGANSDEDRLTECVGGRADRDDGADGADVGRPPVRIDRDEGSGVCPEADRLAGRVSGGV